MKLVVKDTFAVAKIKPGENSVFVMLGALDFSGSTAVFLTHEMANGLVEMDKVEVEMVIKIESKRLDKTVMGDKPKNENDKIGFYDFVTNKNVISIKKV